MECGIGGRTTAFEEPFRDCRNGCSGLGYTLLENKPIDLLIISLGTNDLKYTHASGSGKSLGKILRIAMNSGYLDAYNRSAFRDETRILVISPIAIGADHDRKYPHSLFYGKYEESLRFAKVYQPICRSFGVEFLDAAQYARASETDCLHMDAENHRLLAESDFELKDALQLSYDVKANYKAGTNAERYFPAFAEKMGFRYEKTKDAEALRRCLRTGGAAIVRVSGNREGYHGVFSDRSKHYITAIAEERDGRIVVLDPAYEEGKFEKEDRKGKVEVKGRGMGVCEMKVLEEETEPFEIPFFLFWRG